MLVNMADELQNTSQFFHRFTIPPDLLDAEIPCPGPYLFHSVSKQNQFPHYGQPAVLPYTVPMPHASRYLLELWRDNFPISKKRNSTVWDAIAKKLNYIFKDQGIPSYRTGTQCKARIKYLQDEYKRVKDHNSRSGNNRESFENYDEIDEVLGSEPNITPKEVVECGLAEDANATAVGDSEASPESNIPADHESDADLEQEFEKNLKGNPKRSQKRSKGKAPAVKKVKAASAESNSDLVEFLQESQSKDHKLFECLTDKEAERDLKSQKLMFDVIKEIAKIFKGDS